MKSVHPLYQKRDRYFLPKKLKSQKLANYFKHNEKNPLFYNVT